MAENITTKGQEREHLAELVFRKILYKIVFPVIGGWWILQMYS